VYREVYQDPPISYYIFAVHRYTNSENLKIRKGGDSITRPDVINVKNRIGLLERDGIAHSPIDADIAAGVRKYDEVDCIAIVEVTCKRC